MSFRVLGLLAASFAAACNASPPQVERPAAQRRFSLGYISGGGAPAEGVEVTVYGESDLSTPVGRGRTDASGFAAVVLEPPDGNFVSHARGDGYVDSWYLAHEVVRVQWRNIPVLTRTATQRFLDGLGATWTPGTCIVGTRVGDATGRAKALVAHTDHGGRPYYAMDEDDRFDPEATSSNRGVAFVVGIEPGTATLSLESEGATGARTFECPPDAMVFFEVGLEKA